MEEIQPVSCPKPKRGSSEESTPVHREQVLHHCQGRESSLVNVTVNLIFDSYICQVYIGCEETISHIVVSYLTDRADNHQGPLKMSWTFSCQVLTTYSLQQPFNRSYSLQPYHQARKLVRFIQCPDTNTSLSSISYLIGLSYNLVQIFLPKNETTVFCNKNISSWKDDGYYCSTNDYFRTTCSSSQLQSSNVSYKQCSADNHPNTLTRQCY